MRRWLVLVSACLLFWSGLATAHAVDVFAYAEGREIVGSVHFSNGAPARKAQVTIYGPEGKVLAEPEPDAEGTFRYTAEAAVAHRLVAATGDGHEAEWTVPASALTRAAAPSPEASAQGEASVPGGDTITIDRRALEAMLERAVAREVGPLRQELRNYANQVRLSDIIGGIGGIIGLAGAALWWRSRRREAA